MYYSIARNLEYKIDCYRCNRPLSVAVQFSLDGITVSIGRYCAKYYGIVWTPRVGPYADDPEMYRRAIEIFRQLHYNTNHHIYPRWPEGWQEIKDAIRSVAWKRAAYEAQK